MPNVSSADLSPMSDAFARMSRLNNPTAAQMKPKEDIQALFSNFFARASVMESGQGSSQAASPDNRRPVTAVPYMQIPQRPMRPPNPSMEGFRSGPPHGAMPRFGPPRTPVHGPPESMKFQQHQRPPFTAYEVLNLLPLEMQSLVLGTKVGPEFMKRQDVMQIINGNNL